MLLPLVLPLLSLVQATQQRPPNVVLVLVDDMGYGDFSGAGHPTIRTPNIDRLAADGVRLTQFVTASSVCTPSRAAFLTGCYPRRLGLEESVLFPASEHGLHPEEVTLADCLLAAGYRTACFGKWHLGHRRETLPLAQGFERFVGIPYSNDMARAHRTDEDTYEHTLPFLVDNEVVEWEPDQSTFTRRFTEEAIAWMTEHRSEPFFLYLAHPMPHVPLHPGKDHEGTSLRGQYGDVIEELDTSVGALREALAGLGLLNDTLLLFTSDNGPWIPMKGSAGSAGPFRGGKGSAFEGGFRVPMLAVWPGRIPRGTIATQFVTAMDVAPTIAAACGQSFRGRGPIDGRDVWSLLAGAAEPFEQKAFLYYAKSGALEAVRQGPWKLFLGSGELFHLERDVAEAWDQSALEKKLVDELRQAAGRLSQEIEAGRRPCFEGGTSAFDAQAQHGR